jgi:general secretion pathway protein G
MKKVNNKSGFTLLEIIIVIIIIGVLSSLALPRMFAMTHNAKAVEALNAFKVIRNGMDMCFMMNNNDYTVCNAFPRIGVNDPGLEPGANWTYDIDGLGADTFTVVAQYNDGVVGVDTITYNMNRAAADGAIVVIQGAGIFESISVTDAT